LRFASILPDERNGLVVTIVIYDAQNGIENGGLDQTKDAGAQRSGCVFIANEAVNPCLLKH
jgi:hypothetical protein